MSFAKSHLKAARDHISKKDYSSAKKEAALVLDFEPENYNAFVVIKHVFSHAHYQRYGRHVFLGLALLELGEFDKSEQVIPFYLI